MPAFGFTFYARSIVDGLLHKPTLQQAASSMNRFSLTTSVCTVCTFPRNCFFREKRENARTFFVHGGSKNLEIVVEFSFNSKL